MTNLETLRRLLRIREKLDRVVAAMTVGGGSPLPAVDGMVDEESVRVAQGLINQLIRQAQAGEPLAEDMLARVEHAVGADDWLN